MNARSAGDDARTDGGAGGQATTARPSAAVLAAAVPILPSAGLDGTTAFYTALGFLVLGRTPDYLRLARDGVELHFSLTPDHDPLRNQAGCYLRAADADGLREAWTDARFECLDVPLPDAEAYGLTVFALVDPDGNTLRFGPA